MNTTPLCNLSLSPLSLSPSLFTLPSIVLHTQQAAHELQRSGAAAFVLEDIDFGRRVAVERELAGAEGAPPPNAVFDESGNFLMWVPWLLGWLCLFCLDERVPGCVFACLAVCVSARVQACVLHGMW